MKRLLFTGMIAALIAGCNNPAATENKTTDAETEFVSTQTDGKWSVDRATAEELKGMKNTVENFKLLNKKRFENLPAYQEYGLLLENHIDRVILIASLTPHRKMLCAPI